MSGPGSEIDLKGLVEAGDGIHVVRGSDMCRNWHNFRDKVGLSSRNVGARKPSMNVTTIPPGGVAHFPIHVGFERRLSLLEGRVRHEYGPGLTQVVDNQAGDFLFTEPVVPHEVFNLSDTDPVVARSGLDKWKNIISYERPAAPAK